MSGNHHIWVFGTVGIRMKAKKHVGARFAEKGSWVVTFHKVSDEEAQKVQDRLNVRTRKVLGYRTPTAAMFSLELKPS